MIKTILLSVLFLIIMSFSQVFAQKNGKNKNSDIDPIGIDCDKISISVNLSGVILFSNPVNLLNVSLVSKETGIKMAYLSYRENGSTTNYKVRDLHKFETRYDMLLGFEILNTTKEPEVIMNNISEPCSRRIVIGNK